MDSFHPVQFDKTIYIMLAELFLLISVFENNAMKVMKSAQILTIKLSLHIIMYLQTVSDILIKS